MTEQRIQLIELLKSEFSREDAILLSEPKIKKALIRLVLTKKMDLYLEKMELTGDTTPIQRSIDDMDALLWVVVRMEDMIKSYAWQEVKKEDNELVA